MNYLLLLGRYINYLQHEEGTDHITHYSTTSKPDCFTKSEWSELQAIAEEVNKLSDCPVCCYKVFPGDATGYASVENPENVTVMCARHLGE